MERFIQDMMGWAGITEEEFCTKREISTVFGETLSWEYLSYVREHPIKRDIAPYIPYGEKDHLTFIKTMSHSAEQIGAPLTIMKGGKHWFHTENQIKFLDDWIRMSVKAR